MFYLHLPIAAASTTLSNVRALSFWDIPSLILFLFVLGHSGIVLVLPYIGETFIWLCLIDIARVHFWDEMGFGEHYEAISERLRNTRVRVLPFGIDLERGFIDLEPRAAGGVLGLVKGYSEIPSSKLAFSFLACFLT
jgi:hypothetical protein